MKNDIVVGVETNVSKPEGRPDFFKHKEPLQRHELKPDAEYMYGGHKVKILGSYYDKYNHIPFVLVDDEKYRRILHVRLEELFEVHPQKLYDFLEQLVEDDTELSCFVYTLVLKHREGFSNLNTYLKENLGIDNTKCTAYALSVILRIHEYKRGKGDEPTDTTEE